MILYEFLEFSAENRRSSIWARLSAHGCGCMLNVLSNTEQSKIELAGLLAGVGYSDVLIGSTRFTFKDA
jgi:hypothetical protein